MAALGRMNAQDHNKLNVKETRSLENRKVLQGVEGDHGGREIVDSYSDVEHSYCSDATTSIGVRSRAPLKKQSSYDKAVEGEDFVDFENVSHHDSLKSSDVPDREVGAAVQGSAAIECRYRCDTEHFPVRWW